MWTRQRENENEKEWMTGLCFVLEINSYFDLIFITCSIFALWFDLMFTWQKTYIHVHTAHTPLEQKEHFDSRFFFVGKKNSIFCEKYNVPQIFGTQFITFIFRWYCINRIYFNRLCNLWVVNVSIITSYKLLIYALTLKTIYLTMKTKNYHHAFYLNSKQKLQTRI